MICLVQLLYAEANPKKPLLKCSECVFRGKCSDKAKKMLGWQPKHESALEIIESAWKWQQKFPDGYAQ